MQPLQHMSSMFEGVIQSHFWARLTYNLPQALSHPRQVEDFKNFLNPRQHAGKPVLLICNGHGGESDIAADFVKTLQTSPVPVYTLVTETAYSAAVTVFAAGAHRMMHTQAHLATHAPRPSVGGLAYDREALEIASKILHQNLVKDFDELAAKNRRLLESLTRQRLPDMIFQKELTYLSPEQSKALGFCDAISEIPFCTLWKKVK